MHKEEAWLKSVSAETAKFVRRLKLKVENNPKKVDEEILSLENSRNKMASAMEDLGDLINKMKVLRDYKTE